MVARSVCPYYGDTVDWASQPWTYLLFSCKQVAAVIYLTHHMATRRIVGLLGLPYALYVLRLEVIGAASTHYSALTSALHLASPLLPRV